MIQIPRLTCCCARFTLRPKYKKVGTLSTAACDFIKNRSTRSALRKLEPGAINRNKNISFLCLLSHFMDKLKKAGAQHGWVKGQEAMYCVQHTVFPESIRCLTVGLQVKCSVGPPMQAINPIKMTFALELCSVVVCCYCDHPRSVCNMSSSLFIS